MGRRRYLTAAEQKRCAAVKDGLGHNTPLLSRVSTVITKPTRNRVCINIESFKPSQANGITRIVILPVHA